MAHAALAATHGGEFWPFSIYPMFSAAGRPWARAAVRTTDGLALAADLQREHSISELPGQPLPLGAHGIPENDLSSLVQRAEAWTPSDIEALRELFGDLPCRRPLLVLSVRGRLAMGSVEQIARPVAALRCSAGAVMVQRPRLASAES